MYPFSAMALYLWVNWAQKYRLGLWPGGFGDKHLLCIFTGSNGAQFMRIFCYGSDKPSPRVGCHHLPWYGVHMRSRMCGTMYVFIYYI